MHPVVILNFINKFILGLHGAALYFEIYGTIEINQLQVN